jgi:GTPase SAR1 family protein
MAYLEAEDVAERVLMVGLTQSGKTSIIQVAFEGMLPEDTISNQATGRFRTRKVDLLGSIISVIEVGGQATFVEESLKTYRESLYSHLRILIFVLDTSTPELFDKAKEYFEQANQNAQEFNDKVQVVILAHKIDLVPDQDTAELTKKVSDFFEIDKISNGKVYATTIFDEELIDILEEIWKE